MKADSSLSMALTCWGGGKAQGNKEHSYKGQNKGQNNRMLNGKGRLTQHLYRGTCPQTLLAPSGPPPSFRLPHGSTQPLTWHGASTAAHALSPSSPPLNNLPIF